jgi:hypothetical protein
VRRFSSSEPFWCHPPFKRRGRRMGGQASTILLNVREDDVLSKYAILKSKSSTLLQYFYM